MASTSTSGSLATARPNARSLRASAWRVEKAALLSQGGPSRCARSARGAGASRGRTGAVVVEAKIWTDDGRRRAAELMGLTREEASDGKRLKRAFRKLCLRYHPDIAREEGAVEKFQELQEAYRVLAGDGEGVLDVALPDDAEWSAHDDRWAARYRRHPDDDGGSVSRETDHFSSGVPFDDTARSRDVRKARLEAQLSAMAAAPTRRKRRVVKPLSARPAEAAVTFTEAAPAGDEGDCPSDGCSTDAWDEAPSPDAAPEDDASKQARHAREARRTRGYQSDRHSTESAHERLNSQLAGLHRKKVIRARAAGEEETASRTSAARRSGDEHEVRDETNAARFYGGVGLQLEESTPERFLRLAKLAREWREQRSLSDAIFSADIIKPSAKELLQAAVEGVSLGACT